MHMASYCPKCGYKLSMTDIKPECPVCGVNLVYYGMEDKLKKEADAAEFEHALFQPRIDRLKAATIGSPLAVARLVISVFPLLATLLPMGKVAVSLPFFSENVTVNIITIIQKVFLNLDLDFLFAMLTGEKTRTAYICYFIAVICFVLAVVTAVLNIAALLIACGKRGIRRNITIASIGIFFTAVAQTAFSLWLSIMSETVPEIFSGSALIWGVLGICLAFAAEIVINVICKKKKLKVKYTDVSQYLIPYDERDHSNEGEDEIVKAVD